ncbi:MAG TPA: TonB-dependent receptor [Candidatus Acidoferrales bacterium]
MSSKLRNFVALAAVALALVWCLPSAAQVIKGSISGTVVDKSGAVVAGAEVKAKNIETGAVTTTTSDSAGLFRLSLLPVGTYTVEITAKGFRTLAQNNVAVGAGTDAGLGSLTLEVGEATTTVEVTAPTAPLIETTQAQVTNTFSGETLQEFAGIQENEGLDRLALFVPGVKSSRSNNFSNQNGAGTGFSSNGLRGRNNDQEIDGQNNNDNSVGGPGLFVSDPNFVQEYNLVSNNFGPEYGRNSGSVVNLITRTGSNAWHGTVYGSENSSYLNALSNTQRNTNKPGTVPPRAFTGPPRSNEEFSGGTIGGPAIKDKMFLFGGFDTDIFEGSNVFTTTALTPTPLGLAQLAGCGGISATALTVLSNFGPYAFGFGNPAPRPTGAGGTFRTMSVGTCDGAAGDPAPIQVGGVTRVLGTPFHGFNWIGNTDWQLGKNQIIGRYLYNKGTTFNRTDSGGAAAAAGWFDNVPALSQRGLLGWTRTFGPRMTNDLRGGFSRLNVEFGGGVSPLLPTAGSLPSALTNISFQTGGFLGIGPATNLPQSRIVNTWQAQDNWNYILGRHQLKAGANWTYQRSPNIFLPNINGQFRFASLSQFLAGCATCGPGGTPLAADQANRIQIAQGQFNLDFREYDTFVYGGDDWKITRNLTLNLGLTWTYFGSPANLFNQITAARESNASTAFWLQSLPVSIRSNPVIPAVKKSFGPSAGFAYSPQWGGFLTGHGKTVLRGGYRLAYDPPFYNIFVNISSSAPMTFLQTIVPGGTLLPAVPTGPNVRAALASSITPNTFDPRTQNETNVASNFGPQKVHSWSFGIQRQVNPSLAFEARYVGNHAINLYQTVDANPYLGTATAPGLLQTFPQFVPGASSLTPCAATTQSGPGAGTDVGRVSCGLGVARSRKNGAFSDYQAAQFELRATNLFKQLTVRAGYTYSKTLDNASEIFATGGAGNTLFAAQNPFQTGGAERSISGIDFPNLTTVEFIEYLPFLKSQHGFIGHAVGGWGFSGDYIWGSGQPFTPVQNFAEALSTGAANYYDSAFVAAFVGVDTARPFFGSLSAPGNTVGVFAHQACLSVTVTCSPANAAALTALPATQLVSLNSLNNGSVVAVTSNDVRFIMNTATAQAVFGTPFGNVPRNPLRDAITNIANFSVFKQFKFNERSNFEIRATALNAFNHFNFTNVDVGLEDAGLANFGQGFANPRLFTAAGRTLLVGGRLTW